METAGIRIASRFVLSKFPVTIFGKTCKGQLAWCEFKLGSGTLIRNTVPFLDLEKVEGTNQVETDFLSGIKFHD